MVNARNGWRRLAVAGASGERAGSAQVLLSHQSGEQKREARMMATME